MKRHRTFLCLTLTLLLTLSIAITPVSATNLPEGLSDEEALELIRTGQGYYFGPGVPLDEFQMMRWKSGVNATHQYITAKAQAILKNDKQTVYNWYASYPVALATIVEFSDMPDQDKKDSEDPLRHHFYYIDEGEAVSNNASHYFMKHYNQAVTYFDVGNTGEAFRSLGRALHYLEDASTPVHTSKYMYATLPHLEFESAVNKNLSRFSATSTTLYNTYSTLKLSSIVPDVASYAYNQLSGMSFTDSGYLSVADKTVPRAMQNAATILYRFYLDTI